MSQWLWQPRGLRPIKKQLVGPCPTQNRTAWDWDSAMSRSGGMDAVNDKTSGWEHRCVNIAVVFCLNFGQGLGRRRLPGDWTERWVLDTEHHLLTLATTHLIPGRLFSVSTVVSVSLTWQNVSEGPTNHHMSQEPWVKSTTWLSFIGGHILWTFVFWSEPPNPMYQLLSRGLDWATGAPRTPRS